MDNWIVEQAAYILLCVGFSNLVKLLILILAVTGKRERKKISEACAVRLPVFPVPRQFPTEKKIEFERSLGHD